jgi:putative oxidoreductase
METGTGGRGEVHGACRTSVVFDHFIIASGQHFTPEGIAAAASHHVPWPHVLVPLAGLIALAGGLSVLLGFHTRAGAWLLVSFLVPVTVMMHNFWAVSDAAAAQIERAMFMRNVTMLGGALLISYFGAGPLSLDGLLGGSPHETRDGSSPRSAPIPSAGNEVGLLR